MQIMSQTGTEESILYDQEVLAVAANMQDWGRRYPHAGYGGKFRQWLKEIRSHMEVTATDQQ